jgi:hypothetical protein
MALPSTLANLAPPDEATLIRRLEELERAQRETGPAIMSAIAPMFADITTALTNAQTAITQVQAQQTALQTQINRIDALVNNQVTVGIAGTSTASGWASSTGQATKASSSIGVPAGYSQAFVFALASMHFMDSSPNGGWVRAVILGEAGGEMGGLANLQLGQSASHTRALGGLNGGSISIECQMRSSVATGGMSGRIAQISGFAIFLR